MVLLVSVALEVDLARLGVGPAAGGPAADGGGGDGHDHLGQGQENLKVVSDILFIMSININFPQYNILQDSDLYFYIIDNSSLISW